MKIGSGSVEQLKKAVDFLIAILDHEKTMGKTAMRKLLLRGGGLQVFQFPMEKQKQVERMAKKYGILYSVLPDINKADGMGEIIFHSEAVPRVNMLMQKLKTGKIATFDDYLKNGDEKNLEKVMNFLKGQKRGNDNIHTIEALKVGEALEGLMEIKLITNLISNTTPKGAIPSDPFWEKAESLFLQALFYYVWLEEPPSRRNFETVLRLMEEAEVLEQGKPSQLSIRMKKLEENSPLGANHPAVKQYNKCMRGAGDTVRSIIISANSRLAFLENKQVLRLLSRDDLKLQELGIGVDGDEKTKTALFCVIPDSDKSYNFIIGMLYTQIFQELYYQADFNCGGRLPIHVTFMLDEFANVALPDDFCSLLSTMRSREISSIIIIQNFAQLKALFKDTWETIPGNCDTFIYLGGNEQSTHKYVSELLGKGTIDKKSSGETRGRQGSSSRNYDVLGRELFTPEEVRKRTIRNVLFLYVDSIR